LEVPLVSVVIPTHDRHDLVGRAVASALAQTEPSVEVIVVDDASDPPVSDPADPRVRLVRLERNAGVAATRNAGLREARGRWVTFPDDDDRLLPGMVKRSLEVVAASSLPPPVAAVSGIDVVGAGDELIDRRRPPSYPLGSHYTLEPLPPGTSHQTKQTLVVETELLRAMGGWDEDLGPRGWTDLFLRLNAVCSIEGVASPGYLLARDDAPHLSRRRPGMRRDFQRLLVKHRETLDAHPRGHADLLLGEARIALVLGPRRAFLPFVARAFRLSPMHTLRVLADPRRTMPAVTDSRRTG
jgi:glycosyltransferase involved in cell wall biosynthesis